MADELRKAAFVDRDGVINVERGHVWRVDDFAFIPGAVEGLRQLAAAGYALVVVTNQAGIARGKYTVADFERLSDHMRSSLASSGVQLASIEYCPHHPHGSVPEFAIACDCRKPAPGMLNAAAARLQLNLAGSVLIGDKMSDVEAGCVAGVGRNVLVRSGHPLPAGAVSAADHVCDDLFAAACWVCDQRSSEPLVENLATRW